MHLPPQESIEQLQFELNDTKGRLDALSHLMHFIYSVCYTASLKSRLNNN